MLDIETLKDRYAIQAGGIMLIISFFLPCFELPLLSEFVDISGFNILKFWDNQSFIKPSQLPTKLVIFLITPILFGVSGIMALFNSQTLGGWAWLYSIFIFGYCWYLKDCNTLFNYASIGFYLGIIGSTITTLSEKPLKN
jgi:hypothetical protein